MLRSARPALDDVARLSARIPSSSEESYNFVVDEGIVRHHYSRHRAGVVSHVGALSVVDAVRLTRVRTL
jgi:hypothetical protein